MKFGKSLSNQIEQTLPEWRDKFLSYKDLKKQLKLINPQGKSGDVCNREAKRQRVSCGVAGDWTAGDGGIGGMSKEEIDFVDLLEKEIEKFNSFFVEKEEEYIIKLKELQDHVAKAKDSSEEMIKIRKEMVDFHGEMVLLENYSALNYTGVAKILKKYDKRTGAVLRLPYIQKVLQQPFFTTDLLYKLVKECEALLDLLFPLTEPSASSEEADSSGAGDTDVASTSGNARQLSAREYAELEYMKSLYTKSTISALRVLKEIRSRSSTVSVFSLPPMQVSVLEETWNKFSVLEQLAK
ncbi:unnamed protein product [Lactuca virosa]|uniref:SPX domain-containing protein n=1 Tax=Lactuca virosa TaxID=75947 RepID=A0AAU9PGQ5_9ASTR|nr:unnamed protein product [Lactuca virosa]